LRNNGGTADKIVEDGNDEKRKSEETFSIMGLRP